MHRAVLVRRHRDNVRVIVRQQRTITVDAVLLAQVVPCYSHRILYQLLIHGEARAVGYGKSDRCTGDPNVLHYNIFAGGELTVAFPLAEVAG